MRLVALIMAGGKGIRFGKDIEKTMIELLGKSLEWPNRGTGIVSLARLWAEQKVRRVLWLCFGFSVPTVFCLEQATQLAHQECKIVAEKNNFYVT